MRLIVRSSVVVLLLCVTVCTTPAEAQTPDLGFAIRGIVVDMSKAPIAGARIEVRSTSQAQPLVATTDQSGAFTLTVARGQYRLRITAPGLSPFERDVMAVAAGEPPTEFVLKVPEVFEDVTVTAKTGYQVPAVRSATKTPTPLVDVPQSVTVVTSALIKDQMMTSIGEVMRYVPGISVHQGENNRDQVIIRGNGSSADFFVDGMRDDVQYYRDPYNLERIEALKGPNAMIFGRGGGGGVVNRVSRIADFGSSGDVFVQGGMFGNRRLTAGWNRALNDSVALRVDGMFENSDSFRDFVSLERGGITPTATIRAGANTRVILRYEFLKDTRTADRGVTSVRGRPADVDRATFYGDPDSSDVRLKVNVASGSIEHRAGKVLIRNQSLLGYYDRFYQNYVPGAVNAAGTLVTLMAYNSTVERTNFFNQTDATWQASTGGVRHTLLAGAEFGRQTTEAFRNTGFFNNATTSVLAPFDNPTITTPVTYRQSATDGDNRTVTKVAAVFVQDQVELSRQVQVIAGLRFDHFDLTFHNNRNNETLSRPDSLWSPRVGIVYKPLTTMSIYSSYSVSHLPSSGDQFATLTAITEQIKPEHFRNYEIGAKWDANPNLSVTTAVYRLNRVNVRSTDPNGLDQLLQTGRHRTNGYEIGINGRVTPLWTIAGGYAWQDTYVLSATTAAPAGAKGGQVPHHVFSLWNNYQVHPRAGAALGILNRSDMFATVDNSVVLPGYTRVDAAGFVTLSPRFRVQVNVENLFDKKYHTNADSNTNISFGFPRTVRLGLVATF